MPTIIYSPSALVQQVDNFPKEVERSLKGALYIRPGATVTVTDGEAKHLKTQGVQFIEVGQGKGRRKTDPPPAGAGVVQPVPGVVASGAGPSGADTEQEAAEAEAKPQDQTSSETERS
jgi:hypothetical protein